MRFCPFFTQGLKSLLYQRLMGKSSKQRSEANLMYRPSGVTWLLSVTIEASEMYDVGVDALHPRTTYLVKARVVISRDLLSTVVQYFVEA